MRFRRNLFTGELEQVPSDGGGRSIIYREPLRYGKPLTRHANPWDGKDNVSRPMSIKPEEATPERIAFENDQARYHGTGAYYTPDGKCHTPTKGSRSREMARPRGDDGRRFQDNDAGYSDYCGR